MTISPNKWELDVQGYLNVCNITTATPRKQIRDFSAGVNDLGLWNSMVCWPLRSAQNAATGDIMFSLGGLGTFNATMFNSPVRGENGLTNSATGDMRTNLILAGGPQAHISVSNSTTASVTRSFGGTLSTSNTKGIRFRDDAILWGDGALQFVGRDFTSAGQHKMAAALYNRPNTLRSFLNTTQATAGFGSAVVSGENTLTMMSARDNAVSTQFYSGVFTFYAAISAELSEAQYLSFYTLYKQTLGQGLGLP